MPAPPLLRNRLTASASGPTVQNPSPIRPASSIAFGPNPDTMIGGGVVREVVDARVRDPIVATPVVLGAALPQHPNDLDGLLEHLEPLVGLGPGVAEDVLVERLAAADAEAEVPVRAGPPTSPPPGR